jgi:hypothetical protein
MVFVSYPRLQQSNGKGTHALLLNVKNWHFADTGIDVRCSVGIGLTADRADSHDPLAASCDEIAMRHS